jgi:uncharacterized membrane protein HdeD (DUF308 family)
MVSDQRSAVASSWWLVLIYGIFVGVIGILLLGQPEKTLPVLVTLMGIMWLIQGMFMIGSSFMGGEGWGWRLFGGILSSIAGFIAIAYPIMSTAVTLMVMVYILAFTAIFNGIAEIHRHRTVEPELLVGAGAGVGCCLCGYLQGYRHGRLLVQIEERGGLIAR